MNGGLVYLDESAEVAVTRLGQLADEALDLLLAVPQSQHGVWWYRAAAGAQKLKLAVQPVRREGVPARGAR